MVLPLSPRSCDASRAQTSFSSSNVRCIQEARVQCQRKWRHVLPCTVRTCYASGGIGRRKCYVWEPGPVHVLGAEADLTSCWRRTTWKGLLWFTATTQWHIWRGASMLGVQLEKWAMHCGSHWIRSYCSMHVKMKCRLGVVLHGTDE
jgi:hypothetical protein